MAKRKSNFIARIILVVIMICAIGFVVYLVTSPNGVSSLSSIYVSINDKEILNHASGYTIDSKSATLIGVHYDFDFDESDNGNYTVKVVPNKIDGKDFDVVQDGRPFSYQAIKDLTAGFEINKANDCFTIKARGGIQQILSYVYPNSSIEDCSSFAYVDMFTLLVSSGNKTVSIDFSVVEYTQGIRLDKYQIIY